jgi:hypothetical protein
MKVLISHRGNVNGSNPHLENRMDYIDAALMLGYDVEIDVWYHNSNIYLGHDYPQHISDIDWFNFRKEYIWIHCKNIQAIEYFHKTDFNYFWHEADYLTITSKGYLWVHSGKQPIVNGIHVMPSEYDDVSMCYGICSDTVSKYKHLLRIN